MRGYRGHDGIGAAAAELAWRLLELVLSSEEKVERERKPSKR